MTVADDTTGRWLVVTASMGSGHNRVADLYARALRRRGTHVRVVDLLAILPAGVGRALRSGYSAMLRGAPWLYDRIFDTFFLDDRESAPGVFPLDVLGAHALRPVMADFRPDTVVSTFHLAAQVVGRMRVRGVLSAPSVVAITEPYGHRQWLHPGTDLLVCPYPWMPHQICARCRAGVLAPGPPVDDAFRRSSARASGRAVLGLTEGEHAVLVSTGSWGLGAAADAATVLARVPGVRPVVLCAGNDRLRWQVARIPGCVALGWRDDLARLFAAAAVLVDPSGGHTCVEAFAARLPVVLYRPLPGHGRLGARLLGEHGLVALAEDPGALAEHVRRLIRPGTDRDAQLDRAASVFTADPVGAVMDWRTAWSPATG
jgi:UDP-N-acetylglucosamine:LPS N-acetylglucosamine transferase